MANKIRIESQTAELSLLLQGSVPTRPGLLNGKHRLERALPERVVVLRALPGLGDLLCAVPAFRALRLALPHAHITLIGLPQARAVIERFRHYIDELVEFPGYPGLPEQKLSIRTMKDVPVFFQEMQARSFDLALQMHGSGVITNPVTVLLGARRNAGFYLPGHYCPDPDRFLPYPSQEPEIWRHLHLLQFLGIPLQGDTLEFPLQDQDPQALWEVPGARYLQAGAYVCLHPGAVSPARRWPPEAFAQVADDVAERGWQIVLTGTAGEKALTGAIARAMRAQPLDLAGKTSLGSLAVLLQEARLLICNDTGVSHLAAALQVPSVVIFTGVDPGQSDPQRWAPLNRQRHRVVYPGGVGRTRDGRKNGSRAKWRVTPNAVLAEVKSLLEEEMVYGV